MKRFLKACILLLILATPLLATAEDLAGTFSNADLKLTLRSANGAVEGEATVEGKPRKVKGRITGTKLSGEYEYDGAWVAFTGSVDGDLLTIVSEGESYALRRVGASAAKSASRPSAAALSNDGWGIKMQAPKGWTGQAGQNGFAFTSTTHSGVIAVFPHEATTAKELREGAADGLTPEGGKLAIVGEPKAFGTSGTAATYKGTINARSAKGYAVGLLNPNGSGAVVLAIAEAASFGEAQIQATEAIARSIKFHKVAVPAAVNSWESDLAGSLLEHISHISSPGFGTGPSGSSSRNMRITLCPDRSFWYVGSSHSSIDTSGGSGYSSAKDGIGGTWSVATTSGAPVLMLKYSNGYSESLALSYEARKLYAGGDRYYWSKINCTR